MPDQSFIDELAKRIQKIATKAVPCGTVCAFLRGHVPEGWLLLNGQKVYQKAHANLYEVLSGLSNLAKGSDTTGAYVVLPDMDGRVLQGTSDAGQVGKLLEAQLPNITGTWARGSAYGITVMKKKDRIEYPQPDGAFEIAGSYLRPDSSGVSGQWTGDGGSSEKWYGYSRLGVNASKSNSIYAGSSFQPKAGLMLLCIKE